MTKERKDKDRESLARSERGRTGRHCTFLQPRRQTRTEQHRFFFVTPSSTSKPCNRRFCIRELNGFQFLSGIVCTGMWANFYREQSTGHVKCVSSIFNSVALLAGMPQQAAPPSSTQVGLLTSQAHSCPQV